MTVFAGIGILMLRAAKVIGNVLVTLAIVAGWPVIYGITYCDALGSDVLGRPHEPGSMTTAEWKEAWLKGSAAWTIVASSICLFWYMASP